MHARLCHILLAFCECLLLQMHNYHSESFSLNIQQRLQVDNGL